MTNLHKILRQTTFILAGASIGYWYYTIYGCPDGSCLITSNPVNSMLYMGLVGWLFSHLTETGA